jgi:hypothetical protein
MISCILRERDQLRSDERSARRIRALAHEDEKALNLLGKALSYAAIAMLSFLGVVSGDELAYVIADAVSNVRDKKDRGR